MHPLGLEIRAGLHTGECELMGQKKTGVAVPIGARVAARAQPGEVLVSSTVKDLVAGSEITFEDRGVHELKGVGEWQLRSATSLTSAELLSRRRRRRLPWTVRYARATLRAALPRKLSASLNERPVDQVTPESAERVHAGSLSRRSSGVSAAVTTLRERVPAG
jgi:hypothetical protein